MKMIVKMNLLLLLLLLHYCLGLAAASTATANNDFDCKECDRVHHLPGLNQPLPSPWYSGYLTYEFQNRTIHTHYILVEAEDVVDVSSGTGINSNVNDKPVIYWSNGGPGASSMFGLLTELGPLWFNDESTKTDDYRTTGIPTPLYNPYSWTRLGHVLIIDQPAPVGFSYCNNITNGPFHDCDGLAWTDELTAGNAYEAVKAFFRKFPEKQPNDFYLTGESYGGIYIPTLAQRIMEDEDVNNINLKGFAVGDPCMGVDTTICGNLGLAENNGVDFWGLLFLAGHGQVPLKTFHQVLKACMPHGENDDDESSTETLLTTALQQAVAANSGGFLNVDKYHDRNSNLRSSGSIHNSRDEICKEALDKVKRQVGGFYGYSLYDDCTYSNAFSSSSSSSSSKFLQGGLNDYPCGTEKVMGQYLALPEVQKALHVKSDFFEVDNAVGFDYTPTYKDVSDIYRQANGKKLKVLVYNGDTDPAITSFGVQNWTEHLGFNEVSDWRPWTVDGCRRMGGYVTRYEGNFDFLTIRGSGHMVPTYKPAATFTFLKSWMEGKDYPIFDENCTAPEYHKSHVSPSSSNQATTDVEL